MLGQPIRAVTRAVWSHDGAQKTVASEPAYFAFHHASLDHPRYRLARFPIGFGMIEGACKTVLKPCENSSGMR